jgi:hypothetical protein
LAIVNSSATIARQPEVPNLIAVLMLFPTRGSIAGRKVHTATLGPGRPSVAMLPARMCGKWACETTEFLLSERHV